MFWDAVFVGLGVGCIYLIFRLALRSTLILGPWSAGSCTFTAPPALAAIDFWERHVTGDAIGHATTWVVNATVLVHTKGGETWNTTASPVDPRDRPGLARPSIQLADIYKWWVSELGLSAKVSEASPDAACPYWVREGHTVLVWENHGKVYRVSARSLEQVHGSRRCYTFEMPHKGDSRATVPCWYFAWSRQYVSTSRVAHRAKLVTRWQRCSCLYFALQGCPPRRSSLRARSGTIWCRRLGIMRRLATKL